MQNNFLDKSMPVLKQPVSKKLAFLSIGTTLLFLVLVFLYTKQLSWVSLDNESLSEVSEDPHSEFFGRMQAELERQHKEEALTHSVTEEDLANIKKELERQANDPYKIY